MVIPEVVPDRTLSTAPQARCLADQKDQPPLIDKERQEKQRAQCEAQLLRKAATAARRRPSALPPWPRLVKPLSSDGGENAQECWGFAVLRARGVGLILLCPGGLHEAAFARTGSADTFYRRLVLGRTPAWLREVPLSPDLRARFRLFEVAGRARRLRTASPP